VSSPEKPTVFRNGTAQKDRAAAFGGGLCGGVEPVGVEVWLEDQRILRLLPARGAQRRSELVDAARSGQRDHLVVAHHGLELPVHVGMEVQRVTDRRRRHGSGARAPFGERPAAA
jgi:hypothetical protein